MELCTEQSCWFIERYILLNELGFPLKAVAMKQFCNANETIFDLDAELRKQLLVIAWGEERRTRR
jgi:hypothetical protein